MGVEVLIKLLVSLIGSYVFKPGSAAKYAKWFLQIRDYLLLLFPVETYPENANIIAGMSKDKVAVPIDAVKAATKSHGFDLSHLFGSN